MNLTDKTRKPANQPLAWAVIGKDGGVQRLHYAPLSDESAKRELLYWDRDAGWELLAPHRLVPLYAAPIEVTDEMVEAAWQVLFYDTLNAEEGKLVRAALEAALRSLS